MVLRRHLLAVGVLSLILAAPTAARGATVNADSGVLLYTGAPGETNTLTVVHQGGGTYVLTDGAGITGTDGCAGSPAPNQPVTCTGVSAVLAELADGDDTFELSLLNAADIASASVSGGAGADTILGGPEADTIDPGDGADIVDSRGGDDVMGVADTAADRADCGDGADTVLADDTDIVGVTCETVLRGQPGDAPDGADPENPATPGTTPGGRTGNGTTPTTTTDPDAPTPPGTGGIPTVVRIEQRDRDVIARLRCRGPLPCIGTLHLSAPLASGAAVFGVRRRYALIGGRTATFPIPISAGARAFARRHPRAGLRVVARSSGGLRSRLGTLRLH